MHGLKEKLSKHTIIDRTESQSESRRTKLKTNQQQRQTKRHKQGTVQNNIIFFYIRIFFIAIFFVCSLVIYISKTKNKRFFKKTSSKKVFIQKSKFEFGQRAREKKITLRRDIIIILKEKKEEKKTKDLCGAVY